MCSAQNSFATGVMQVYIQFSLNTWIVHFKPMTCHKNNKTIPYCFYILQPPINIYYKNIVSSIYIIEREREHSIVLKNTSLVVESTFDMTCGIALSPKLDRLTTRRFKSFLVALVSIGPIVNLFSIIEQINIPRYVPDFVSSAFLLAGIIPFISHT